MKNVFLYYGEEEFLINEAISKIIDENPNGQVIKYDLSDISLNLILEDASSQSLFDDNKIIIVYNSDFLSGSPKKEISPSMIDNLNKYINNPNPSTIIVFVLYDKVDKRKSIVKNMINKTINKEFNKLSDDEVIRYIKSTFTKQGYQINVKALSMLVERTGNNLYLISSEAEKLMEYKFNDKTINEYDIEEMIVKYDYDNIFALTDAVVKKDINNSLLLYQELLKRGEEPIKIIVLLANQFRLIFQSKRLSSKGFSEAQIASDLGIHPYRIKLSKQVDITEKEALEYLNLLATLDENIKMGKTNKEVGLEMFFLSI
jgi:DNA polymerase-3 subunit delta